MPKVTCAAIAAVVLLTLAGCAGTPQEPASDTSKPAASPSETTAPLIAETPSTAANEEAFLKAFRDIQVTYPSIIPNASDEQLLVAGAEACERLSSGEASTDISLIEGEERNPTSEMFLDSVSIVTAAQANLCP